MNAPVQSLEDQEQEAWNAYLAHAAECTNCPAWYAYCDVADKLLSKVTRLRDSIGWGPR